MNENVTLLDFKVKGLNPPGRRVQVLSVGPVGRGTSISIFPTSAWRGFKTSKTYALQHNYPIMEEDYHFKCDRLITFAHCLLKKTFYR